MNVRKFFVENTNYSDDEINSMNPIHQGYTNTNYHITTNDNKEWVIRFSNQVNLKYANEKNAYDKYGKITFLNFNVKDGSYIKEYISGETADFDNKTQIKMILNELLEVHKLDTVGIHQHNWDDYINNSKLKDNIKNEFILLVDKYKNTKKTFTHHDLNPANILISKEKAILIDFEWARVDDPYFDYASITLGNKHRDFIIEEMNLDKTKILDFEKMIIIYSYMWCESNNTEKIKELQMKLLSDFPWLA